MTLVRSVVEPLGDLLRVTWKRDEPISRCTDDT